LKLKHGMRMTKFIVSCLFLAQIGLIQNLSYALNTNNNKSPSFIVILTDDQSYVGTSFLTNPEDPRTKSDYYQTPNMDRLAQL